MFVLTIPYVPLLSPQTLTLKLYLQLLHLCHDDLLPLVQLLAQAPLVAHTQLRPQHVAPLAALALQRLDLRTAGEGYMG